MTTMPTHGRRVSTTTDNQGAEPMSTSTLEHRKFCLPRPGLDKPRLETYLADKYADDGTPAGHVSVYRCQECGVASFDGVQRDNY